MNFARSSSIVLFFQILLAALSFLTGLIIARILGPEGKGAYALLVLIPFMLATFSELGIGLTNIYFFGKQPKDAPLIIANSLLLWLAITVAVIALYFALFFKAGLSLRGISTNLLTFSIISFPFILITLYLRSFLLAHEQAFLYGLLGAIDNIFIFVALAGALLLNFVTLPAVVVITTLGALIRGVLVLFFVLSLSRFRLTIDYSLFKETAKKGIKLYFGNILQLVNYRLDIFLVGLFVNLASVGQYSVAVGISALVWYLPDSVAQVLLPRVSKEQTPEEANNVTRKVLRITIILVLLASLPIILLSRWLIVLLYGANFLPAHTALLVLMPGTIVFAIPKVLVADLVGRGHPEVATISAASAVFVTIALDVILIPRYGILGAAFTSSIAYIIYALVMLIYFLRITNTSIIEISALTRTDFGFFRNAFRRSSL